MYRAKGEKQPSSEVLRDAFKKTAFAGRRSRNASEWLKNPQSWNAMARLYSYRLERGEVWWFSLALDAFRQAAKLSEGSDKDRDAINAECEVESNLGIAVLLSASCNPEIVPVVKRKQSSYDKLVEKAEARPEEVESVLSVPQEVFDAAERCHEADGYDSRIRKLLKAFNPGRWSVAHGKEERCALLVQRKFRGIMGRKRFAAFKKEM